MDISMLGPENGPTSQLNYKRAILRPTPREFTIEILAPVKHGGNYSYGVRVCPISRPISDTRSISSRVSNHAEYEIWRRWEDCIEFQNTLELEYEQLSRRKVKVLKRGGKKQDTDSIYSQFKAASSFDSLPEGPDPREIALNVRDLIPQLNKKGTLFRPSRATIEQRGVEFAAMMRGLFNPDPEAPVLLRQLRNCETVRNFFAYWRRDQDTAEKYGPKMIHSNRSLSSILPLSGQEQEFPPPLPSPPPSAPFPTTPLTPAPTFDPVGAQQHVTTIVPARGPPFTPQTHGDNFYPAAPSVNRRPSHLNSSRSVRPELSAREVADPLDPWQGPDGSHNITPIVEDVEYSSQPRLPQWPTPPRPPPLSRRPSNADTLEPARRPRSNSSTAPGHQGTGYPQRTTSTRRPEGQLAQQLPQASLTHTLHSFSSSPSLRDRHDKSLKYPPSSSNFSQTSISSRFSNMSLNRSSVNSSASEHTHASKSSQQGETMYDDGNFDYDDGGAALPGSPLSTHRTPLSNIDEGGPAFHQSHRHRTSVSSIRTEASADGVLPPHLRDARSVEDERSERESHTTVNSIQRNVVSSLARRGSAREFNHRYSGSSMSSSSSFGDTVAIKATYHDHIIMFRAERTSTLRDIRQRVRERLALHESVPMQSSFLLAYNPNWSSSSQRVYSNSDVLSSSDNLRVLQEDQDWQTALSACNGMIRVRVLDSEAFPRYI